MFFCGMRKTKSGRFVFFVFSCPLPSFPSRLRQSYTFATPIVQIARHLPISGIPYATVIYFRIIDRSDCVASSNRDFRLRGICEFQACQIQQSYTFLTSAAQIVRLLLFLIISDATVIHLRIIGCSDGEAFANSDFRLRGFCHSSECPMRQSYIFVSSLVQIAKHLLISSIPYDTVI